MALTDIGLNSDSIHFEVALEVLGESRQPFMEAIRVEKEKERPSQAFIAYCDARLVAIDDLQEDLEPSDLDTIEKILDKGNRLLRL